MIITAPKNFKAHGTLPDGTMLFSNKNYSVAVTLDKQEPIVSVNARGISRTKESDAVEILRKFGITHFERFSPRHRHNAVYFKILNE